MFITALLSEPPPRHAQKTTTEGGENGKGSKRRDSTPTNCGGGGVRDVSMNEGTAVQQFFSLLISLLFSSSSSSHIIQVSLSLSGPLLSAVLRAARNTNGIVGRTGGSGGGGVDLRPGNGLSSAVVLSVRVCCSAGSSRFGASAGCRRRRHTTGRLLRSASL